MGAVRKSGLALLLALSGTVTIGGQAAYADGPATLSLPAAPAPDALLSQGVGTAPQVVALPVPDQGHDGLLDADGNLVDSLAIDGVGTYDVDVNGILTFTPALGYVGTHSVVFEAIDAYDQTGDSTYTPEVDLPAGPTAATLTSSDVGTNVQSVSVAVPEQGGAALLDSTGTATSSTTLSGVGAFRIDASGAITFAPAFGYMGTASISYEVTDAYGQSTTGAYTPSVVPPHAPVAVPATTRAGPKVQQVVRLHVPAGTTLALIDPSGTVTDHVYIAGQGNYAVDPASASITFTPGADFVGTGSLTYQLTDAYGQVSQSAYTPVVLRTVQRTVAVQPIAKSGHSASSVPGHASQLTPAVLVPPLVLTAPGLPGLPGLPSAVPLRVVPLAHAKAKAAPVRATVRVQHVKPNAPAPAVPAVAPPAPAPAVASGLPAASVVEQQLTAATTVSSITHNPGKLAGLALIVVNSFVGLAALMLNRRRRNT